MHRLSLLAAVTLSLLLGTPAAAENWWQRLGDAELAGLVDAALANNADVAQVAARLDQAQAAARAARAGLLPELGASGSAATLRQSLEDPAIRPFANLPGFPRQQARYSAGLAASWEIDLFGGGARRQGARAQAEAAAADFDAARVAIAAETASVWIGVRALQARRALMAATAAALTAEADLVGQRAAAGVADGVALDRVIAARAAHAAALAALDGLIAAEVEGLGVLIADAAAARAAARRHAAEPFQPAIQDLDGLTVSIAARPDVIAAERRLAAADAALRVAQSQRYPRLSIGALLTTIATAPSALFTAAAQATQGNAVLSLPLLDFGRIDAAIAEARGNRKATLAAARKATLAAAADVARSAAVLGARRTEVAAQQVAFAASTASCARQTQAHAQGVVDRIALLASERDCRAAEISLLAVRAEAMKALVSVFRATGTLNAPGA